MYEYKAIVTEVIDGDTVSMTVDVGFYMFTKIRVRLLHINAPEIHTKDLEEKKRGLVSKTFLKSLLEGKDVIVKTQKTDNFGRWLGEVFLDDGEHSINVNQLLVDQGYAVPFMTE